MLLGWVFIPLVLVGCSWGSGASDSREDGALDAIASQGQGVFDEAPAIEEAWTIILSTLPEGQESAAGTLLDRVRTVGGLPEARTQLRSGRVSVVFGSYDGPEDQRAAIDLDRIKGIERNGNRIYAGAYLAPPGAEALSGSSPEHDLRTAKERFGKGALYTLQVGVYGSMESTTLSADERRAMRTAAETAVRELRAQGERAFYYHAPNQSMVTVGIFGTADFDSSTYPPIESTRLRESRERFPHNLLNGSGIRETVMTDTGQRVRRLQPSVLVGIPDS